MTTVEFEVHFKEEIIAGYMYVEEAGDEAPLRFYSNGGEQWNIPSNPHRNPLNNKMLRDESDYDFLVQSIQECSNFVNYLVKYQKVFGKEIVIASQSDLDDVILIIN